LLEQIADEVKMFGHKATRLPRRFPVAAREMESETAPLRRWGELNGALFHADLVDEIHLTICPQIVGGKTASHHC